MISISGLMAVPTWVRSSYRSGKEEMVLLHTPTRSRSSRSQISAVAGDVAMILGSSSIAATLAFAASTAAFSSGSSIARRVSTLSTSWSLAEETSFCPFITPQPPRRTQRVHAASPRDRIFLLIFTDRFLLIIIFASAPASPVSPEIIDHCSRSSYKKKSGNGNGYD